MNFHLHCATNRMTLGNSSVSQHLSFCIYIIETGEASVNNQYKLQFQGFYCIGFYVADLQYLHVQKEIDAIRVASSQGTTSFM